MMRRLIRFILGALGICSGCSKSPLLTPGQFTQEVAEAFRTCSLAPTVEVVKDLELKVIMPDEHPYTSFLDNSYDVYKRDPSAKVQVIERVVAAFEEIADVRDGIDRTRIVPVIKDRPWVEETRLALLNRGAQETPEPVYDDFNQDLIVLYAEDSAQSMRYFRLADLEAAGIERNELMALACENLQRMLPKIEVHGSNGLYMVTAGGDYEASLLLFDGFWGDGQIDVQGDIVVAIPTRDLLLVTGSQDPAGVDKVKQVVQDAYSKGPYRLTPKLFVYRGGHFVEFEQ